MIYTFEIESDRTDLQAGDDGLSLTTLTVRGVKCRVRQSIRHDAPPNRTPVSAIDALWSIWAGDVRPGHPEYLTKREMATLAKRALNQPEE